MSSMAAAPELFGGTTHGIGRAKTVKWNIAWRLEVVGVCVEEEVGNLKVWLLPAATWLSTLGSAPKEPSACCLGDNL